MTKPNRIISVIITALLLFFIFLGSRWAFFGAGFCTATLLFVSLGSWAEAMNKNRRDKAWNDYTEILSGGGKAKATES